MSSGEIDTMFEDVPSGGLKLLTTGKPIPADDSADDNLGRRFFEGLDPNTAPQSSKYSADIDPNTAALAQVSATISTVTIRVPAGYSLGQVWEQVDSGTRAAALTAAGDAMAVAFAAGKACTPDVELRVAQTSLLELKAQYAANAATEKKAAEEARAKLATEVDFLRNGLGASMEKIGAVVSSAFGKQSAAKEKGDIGESIIESWVSDWFPSCTITKYGAGHAMDFLVTIPPPVGADAAVTPLRLLLEVKNKLKVQTSDVEQFERDVVENRLGADAAMFVSLRCPKIPNRGELQVSSIGRTTVVYLGGQLEQQSRDVRIVVETLRQFAIKEQKGAPWDSGKESMLAGLGKSLKILRDAESRAQRAARAAIQLQQDVAFLAEAIAAATGMMSGIALPLPAVVHGNTKAKPGVIVRKSAPADQKDTALPQKAKDALLQKDAAPAQKSKDTPVISDEDFDDLLS